MNMSHKTTLRTIFYYRDKQTENRNSMTVTAGDEIFKTVVDTQEGMNSQLNKLNLCSF